MKSKSKKPKPKTFKPERKIKLEEPTGQFTIKENKVRIVKLQDKDGQEPIQKAVVTKSCPCCESNCSCCTHKDGTVNRCTCRCIETMHSNN